jgi:membrane-bound ClpP family serine protease
VKGSTARSIVALITVLGFALVFGIAYTGANPRIGMALQMLLLTLTIFVAGYALVRRDPAGLVIAAGLAAWSIDTFYPHNLLTYGGIALYLVGFFLTTRSKRATT